MHDKYAIDLNDSQLIMSEDDEYVGYLPRFLVFVKVRHRLRVKLIDGTNEHDVLQKRYGSIHIHRISPGDKQ